MKRVVRIRADDGRTVIRIEASIESSDLTRDEMSIQATSVARELTDALEHVRWTDFGVENVRVN